MLEQIIICGIDEVGRGPLAGPVVAAAVILPVKRPRFFREVTDSKKLTREQREALFPRLHDYCQIGIGQASVEEIDTINIYWATFLAMERAFAALPVTPHKAMIDGNRAPKNLPCPVETIIKGDLKRKAIGAASIIAKVTRDRIMIELDAAHPGYDWASNVGYGVPKHYKALNEIGLTPHHRRSFPVVQSIMAERKHRIHNNALTALS